MTLHPHTKQMRHRSTKRSNTNNPKGRRSILSFSFLSTCHGPRIGFHEVPDESIDCHWLRNNNRRARAHACARARWLNVHAIVALAQVQVSVITRTTLRKLAVSPRNTEHTHVYTGLPKIHLLSSFIVLPQRFFSSAMHYKVKLN